MISQVESSEVHGFALSRMLLIGGRYVLDLSSGQICAVLVVTGVADFRVDGEELRVGEGAVALFDGSSAVEIIGTAGRESVRYAWSLLPGALSALAFRSMFHRAIPAAEGGRSALLSFSNALLNQGKLTSSSATLQYARACEHLLTGILMDRPALTMRADASASQVLIAAQAAIEGHFRNPLFNVDDVARAAGISHSTLHRHYKAIGSSPRVELEKRRVVEAHVLLATSNGMKEYAYIAYISGFKSSRALLQALRRHPALARPSAVLGVSPDREASLLRSCEA